MFATAAVVVGSTFAVICASAGESPSDATHASDGPPAADHERVLEEFRSQLRDHEAWEMALIADKQDLLRRLADAESERDSLKRRAYLTESTLADQQTMFLDRNNPFQQLDLRKESGFEECRTLGEFLERASKAVERRGELDGLPGGSSKAVLSMLLISGLFEFGREVPNDGLAGCVSDAVRLVKGANEPIRFGDYQRATHGCCVDFSVLLLELLRHQHIPCELRMSKAHAVVEVRPSHAKPFMLDASSSLAIWGLDSRATDRLRIYRFSARDNSRKIALQSRVMLGMAFLLEETRPKDFVQVDYHEFCAQYGIMLSGTDSRSD
jgi:hypothetical protein